MTGLYYYGARYYDPRVSVWLSVDPLASKYPYVTPYNFVENNPIRLVDPTGLGPDCADCPEGSIDPVVVTPKESGAKQEKSNPQDNTKIPVIDYLNFRTSNSSSSSSSSWWQWPSETSGKRRQATWLENLIDQVFSQEEIKNIGGAAAGAEAAFNDGRYGNTLYGFERGVYESEGNEPDSEVMGPPAPSKNLKQEKNLNRGSVGTKKPDSSWVEIGGPYYHSGTGDTSGHQVIYRSTNSTNGAADSIIWVPNK